MQCILHVVNIEIHTLPNLCIYLGADIYLATNWQAPSQKASGIWHLLKNCELTCVSIVGISHKAYLITLGRRFIDALTSDIF